VPNGLDWSTIVYSDLGMSTTERQTPRQTPRDVSETVEATELAQSLGVSLTEDTSNPLLSVGGWVWDLTLYGVGFGLVASLPKFDEAAAAGVTSWIDTVFLFSFSSALLGALSGLSAGVALKALRGRVPPAFGLLVGVLASIVPYVLILLMVGKTYKMLVIFPIWALAIMMLIPLIAVRRSKALPVARWSIGLGMLAAAATHLVMYFIPRPPFI
jgi:hypothetical protein